MMEFLKIVAGGCILSAICFIMICMLDIPAYLKRPKKKAIYEFDCEIGGVPMHISVLEKFTHYLGLETFRRLRIEYVTENDIAGRSYGVLEAIVGEHEYVTYLNCSVDKKVDIHG